MAAHNLQGGLAVFDRDQFRPGVRQVIVAIPAKRPAVGALGEVQDQVIPVLRAK